MFAWWGRAVVRLRWWVLAAAAVVLILGGSWGAAVFGELTSGGFDDPGSPSRQAPRASTAPPGRPRVDGPGL